MVSSSLSILHSTTSSFPSFTSNTFSDNNINPTPTPTRNKPLESSGRILRYQKPLHLSSAFKVLASSSFPSPSPLEDGSAEQFLQNNSIADFMRFKRGVHGGNGELQTAVVSYRKRFPWALLQPFLQVDLVSTIHIADQKYFKTLQEEVESCDCVLYEMVASRESLENRRNPAATKKLKSSRSRGFNILGCIQRQMARILMLDFQLDCLDYQAENWYHADLDFETFRLLQMEKGESFFTFARDMTIKSTKAMIHPASVREDLGPWRSKLLWASRVLPMPLVGLLIIGGVCADVGSQTSEFPELEALSRLEFGSAMKVFLAKRLTSEFTQVMPDVEEESVIIGERNKAAIEALQTALDEGHNRIAILYGGGHMPDLGRRLREEFDLVPSRVRWITAWSIGSRNLKSSSLPFLKTMAKISGWPLNRYQTLALLIFSSVLALDLWFWEIFCGTAVNCTNRHGKSVWTDLLFRPSRPVRRILIAAVGVHFFMQASGNETVVYYSPEVFREAGIQSERQLVGVTVTMGTAKTSFVLYTALFLDNVGRRPLLLLGSAGMALSLAGLGLGTKFLEYVDPKPEWAIALCVVALSSAVSFFSIGLGPITWVYSSEIFPMRFRAQGSSLAISANRLVSGLVSMTFLSVSEKITFGGMFYVLSGIMALATVFFYLFCPETKGKSLEEIGAVFEDEVHDCKDAHKLLS